MVQPGASFTFPRDVEVVPRIRRFVSKWFDQEHVHEPVRSEMLLAVGEAVNNASIHTPPETRAIHLRCSKHQTVLTVAISDHGHGFEFRGDGEEPPWEQTGGRGLFLMQHLVDHVAIQRTDEGTTVVLTRDLSNTSHPRSAVGSNERPAAQRPQ